MTEWSAPPKTNELTENRLITAILEGVFPINSNLPSERDLARQLGVTRPTLPFGKPCSAWQAAAGLRFAMANPLAYGISCAKVI